MQTTFKCPNCNWEHAVPTGQTINGQRIIACLNCSSTWLERSLEPVVLVADGGDDVPDEPGARYFPERLQALKADLEAVGCSVDISAYDDGKQYTVYIVYPPDVPPPTEQDDPEAPDGWFDDEDEDDG